MLNQLAPEQSSASALLRLEDVSRVFDIRRGLFGEKRSLVAVDGVSLSLAKGASLGLVGESGCGKSTTGRSILRLIEPTAGEVLFEGKDVTKLSRLKMRHMRKDMQIIFQDPFPRWIRKRPSTRSSPSPSG